MNAVMLRVGFDNAGSVSGSRLKPWTGSDAYRVSWSGSLSDSWDRSRSWTLLRSWSGSGSELRYKLKSNSSSSSSSSSRSLNQ